MDRIVQKVKNNLVKLNIKNCSILVAFSGGIDSSTLIDILEKIAKQYNLKLTLAYINHNLRADSCIEDNFIIKKASEKNITLYKYDINKIIWKNLKKESIEMAARKIRYDFLKKTAIKNKIDYIATAHNANDKIETFFINLFRASGINTLRSIQLNNKNIIRPMINVTRKEIEQYINENQIEYYEDSTNHENYYKRNIIRNKILPVFSEVHHNYEKSFEHIFKFFNEEYDFIMKITLSALKKCLIFKRKNVYCLNLEKFKRNNIIIKKSMIKIIIDKINLKSVITMNMLNELSETKEKYSYNTKKILCKISGCYIWFVNKASLTKINHYYKIFQVPSEISIDNIYYTFKKSINTDLKKNFIFSFNDKMLPLTIRSVNDKDEIFVDEKNKKNIIKILKSLKIPELLYNEILVFETASGEIAGFKFENIFRTAKNFYVNDINDNRVVFIKTDSKT